MRRETSASLWAGALAGFCFGFAITAIFVLFNWHRIFQTTQQLMVNVIIGQQYFPTQTEFLSSMFSLSILAGLLSTLPGTVMGLIYVKTANCIPVLSTRSKAVLFGFILWLVPLVIGISAASDIGTVTAEIFVGSLLAVSVGDALVFAYVFNHVSTPTVKGVSPPTPMWVAFLQEPRKAALAGLTAVVCMLSVLLWRMIQMLPELRTDLTTQVTFAASVVIVLVFVYASTYLGRYLFQEKTTTAF